MGGGKDTGTDVQRSEIISRTPSDDELSHLDIRVGPDGNVNSFGKEF